MHHAGAESTLAPGQLSCRLGIVQRVLAHYRVSFFDELAVRCGGGVSVFAGQPALHESLTTASNLKSAKLAQRHNYYIPPGGATVYWQPGLARWLERWQPTALIMEANPRALSTRVGVRWMRSRGRPVLGWGLGTGGVIPSQVPGGKALRAWRRGRYLQMFDAILAYSSQAAAQYRALGIPAGRVFVCHNAVTSPPAEPPHRSPSFGKAPVVLFVGTLTRQKRVDVLLRACAALERSRPDLAPELRIVGGGDAEDGLQTLARDVYPKAQFLGAMHGAPLQDQFRSADLFVLPGLGGLAVHEAMSHGLPVIVGEADGTQEDLVSRRNGWHLPAGRPDELEGALTQALAAALSDVERLRAMGAESFRIVADEINLDRMADAIIAAVSQTI